MATNDNAHAPPEPPAIPLTIHFHGGLAPLFLPAPQDRLTLALPALDPRTQGPATLGTLVAHLDATYLADGPASKRALFVQDGGVRAGILVLVDDADWELEGGEGRVLEGGEEVIFVSTLHGG